MHDETFAGGVTTPAGFIACGRRLRHQGRGPAAIGTRPGADRRRPTATAAAVFTTNKARRCPGGRLAGAPASRTGVARAIVVNSGCANACTGAAGHRRSRATWRPMTARRCSGCHADQVLVASTGVIGVQLKSRRSRNGSAAASPRSAPTRRRGRDARHHDDRSVSERSRRARAASTARRHGRRHGEGLRHDRADDGHHARLRHHRRGTCRRRCCSGPCGGGRRHVQRHHRGRRVLHQRLRVAAGERRESASTIDEATYDALRSEPLRAVCRPPRPRRSCAAAKARRSWSRSASPARHRQTMPGRRAKAIANSPLVKTAIHGGDPNWGRLWPSRAGPASRSISIARRSTIGAIVLFKDGRPYDERAPEAATYLQERRAQRRGRPRHRRLAPSTVWTCDLQRRIREDQRGVPDLSGYEHRRVATAHPQGLSLRPRLRRDADSSAASSSPAHVKADRSLGAGTAAAAARRPARGAAVREGVAADAVDLRDRGPSNSAATSSAAAGRRRSADASRVQMSPGTSNAGWTALSSGRSRSACSTASPPRRRACA